MITEYERRRAKLAHELESASIAILPSAKIQYRNHDAEWPFRQNSDFYYLTGFLESQAVFVLVKNQDNATRCIIFNKSKDLEQEIWNGKILGQVAATEELNIDEAYPIQDIDTILPTLLNDIKTIYYPIEYAISFHTQIMQWLQSAKKTARMNKEIKYTPGTFKDLLPLIHELRLFKSEYEINELKQAAQVSAAAHINAMQRCRPNLTEYQIEAGFNYDCQEAGCCNMAYSSIVASGSNACTLHYVDNNCVLQDGDLLLIDAGCESNYYAADITRTFPVNGVFSKPQRQIYELVLKAQTIGIEQVKPGTTFNKIQESILEVLVAGMVDLGLLKGFVSEIISSKAYKQFYMHNSGHWLGLDVHDVGRYRVDGQWRKLEPGMVLTVEPGLYIREDCEDVAKCWRGIGVRIEDDILVTTTGYEILSKQVPKTIVEIEQVMANGKL